MRHQNSRPQARRNQSRGDENRGAGNSESSQIARLDKQRLTALYLEDYLPLEKIGAEFGLNSAFIDRALEFHHIPKRRPKKSGGRRIPLLRSLEIGESAEIESDPKHPVQNLYEIAKRVPIKISVRRLRSGKIAVTRIG